MCRSPDLQAECTLSRNPSRLDALNGTTWHRAPLQRARQAACCSTTPSSFTATPSPLHSAPSDSFAVTPSPHHSAASASFTATRSSIHSHLPHASFTATRGPITTQPPSSSLASLEKSLITRARTVEQGASNQDPPQGGGR